MKASPKSGQLNIRASESQKARLAEAARLQNMNVSQFVLTRSLNAADEVIADQRLIRVTAEEYDWLASKLEEAPKDNKPLLELFESKSVFEK